MGPILGLAYRAAETDSLHLLLLLALRSKLYNPFVVGCRWAADSLAHFRAMVTWGGRLARRFHREVARAMNIMSE